MTGRRCGTRCWRRPAGMASPRRCSAIAAWALPRCKPQHRAALMDLMEGVEEIPGVVLADGLTWEWESFPDFLDALERRPHAIDVAAQVAHLPLRVYVMGDRAVRLEAAKPDDIAEMRRLTIEALRAGAFGFTTSRTNSHKTPAGRHGALAQCRGRRAARHRFRARRRRRRRIRHEQRFRRRGGRTRLDDQTRQGDRPPGLVPAHRSLRRPGALAAPARCRACRAQRRRAS